MSTRVDKTELRKKAILWSRALYLCLGFAVLASKVWLTPSHDNVFVIFAATALFWRALTYQPNDNDTDNSVGATIDLAWTKMMFCVAGSLAVIFVFTSGQARVELLIGGILLAGVLGPTFMIWYYLRRRNS